MSAQKSDERIDQTDPGSLDLEKLDWEPEQSEGQGQPDPQPSSASGGQAR